MSQKQEYDTTREARWEIINQSSLHSSDSYCFVQGLLDSSNSRESHKRYCGQGCAGEGKCPLRDELFRSGISGKTIAQSFVMVEYSHRQGMPRNGELNPTIMIEWAKKGGSSKKFREAWASGVTSPIELEVKSLAA
ncbi:hypothetical protein CMI41_02200 [Candidatus Pacearchaeota archaeon]|nr:hypothetical protein [Candidatus Pacearchaeota archaeon]|tara:strand:+ start:4675 stop:5082 length:408 start_codon:yes stop_codon:yes gene_type:complete